MFNATRIPALMFVLLLPLATASCDKKGGEAQVAANVDNSGMEGDTAQDYEPEDYGHEPSDNGELSVTQGVEAPAMVPVADSNAVEAAETETAAPAEEETSKKPVRTLPAGIAQSAKLTIGPSCTEKLKRTAVRGVCVGDVHLDKLNQYCAITSLVTIKDKPKDISYNSQEGHERALHPADMPNAAGTVLVKKAEYECPGYGVVSIQSAYNDDKGRFDYQVIGAETVVCVPEGMTMEPGSPLFSRLQQEYGKTDLFEPNRVYQVETATTHVQVRYPQMNGGSPAPCSDGQMPLATILKAQPQLVRAEVNYVLSKYEAIQNANGQSAIDTTTF